MNKYIYIYIYIYIFGECTYKQKGKRGRENKGERETYKDTRTRERNIYDYTKVAE